MWIRLPACLEHCWFRYRPARLDQDRSRRAGSLSLVISEELVPVVAQVLATVTHLFDLDADPVGITEALGTHIAQRPGLRVPGAASGFEMAVRAVLGQQITVNAARTLAERFVMRFGQRHRFVDNPELHHSFPSAERIARARQNSIAELGIIGRRAATIRHLAAAIATGEFDLSPTAPVEETLAKLKAVPGIGDWTAQYLAMRALRWPDAFPAADYGVMKAMGIDKPGAARLAAEAWRPWRSYAVMQLWASLEPQESNR